MIRIFILAVVLPIYLASAGPTSADGPGHARIQSVIRLINSLEHPDPGAVEIISDVDLVQHNTSLADGSAAMKAYFLLPPAGTTVRIVRAFADGDYVVTQSLVTSGADTVVIDVFRFSGEQVVEHWDNAQALCAVPNPSGRTQIDGPTGVADLDMTDANKASLEEYFEVVVLGGHYDRAPEFKAQTDFHQHNCDNGDTRDETLAANVTPPAFKIVKPHLFLGQGNFGLVMSEGTYGDRPVAFFDLYRFENGKQVEHWDVIQDLPAPTNPENPNGKF